MGNSIHIADANNAIFGELAYALEKSGFKITRSINGRDALDIIQRENPSLCILEANLTEIDGFTLCKTLRSNGYKKPIIFLTERISEIDAVIGLGLGAQDYIRKPLQLNEVMARIQIQLNKYKAEMSTKISLNDIEIDIEQRKVRYKGNLKELTNKEFQLLYTLAQKPNKVFSRDELLNHVWGWTHIGETRTVDIHIGYLRKKFEEDPRRPKILQTIRGVGYTLVDETDRLETPQINSFQNASIT